MKNNITLNIFSLIAIILISACGSNSNITKRQYTKGYYVAHSKYKRKVVTTTKEEKIVHIKTTEPSTSIPINESSKETFTKTTNLFNDNKNLIASTNKKPILINTHIVVNHPLKSLPKFNVFPIKEKKDSFLIKKRLFAPMHDGEGLSLFWIVIVVLLVLWALGLLSGGFGLGGLINLLLIIALILLILWLLRII